jgi:hypothetical protein
MKRRILVLLMSAPITVSAYEGCPQSPGDSILFLGNGPDLTVCKICRSAYALCALHSIGFTPCFRKPGFRIYD